MKNIFLSLLIVLFGISVSGQQLIKQDYLKKSKNQKTMAWILTSGGSALVLGGIISYGAESDVSYYPGKTVGTILMACGAVAITGGIISFSASKKNERKANEMAIVFNMKLESTEIYRYKIALKKYYPAVSLNLKFR
jgi:hypothetical protein